VNWLGPYFEPAAGAVLVLLAAGLMLWFSLFVRASKRGRSRTALRPIRSMQRLRRAIGLAVEDGSRLHVSIGKASIISSNNTSALIGLSTLERISTLSSVSDRPAVATSGDGTLTILSQDTTRAAYRISNVPEYYDPHQARLAGPTPFSYIAGTLPVVYSERVSTHILVGNFGPEIGLLTDAVEREDAFVLAASDSFAAQAVIYASATEPLIGEELFAVPAYLQTGSMHQAGLRAQDVLRWLVIGALVVGAFVSLFMTL